MTNHTQLRRLGTALFVATLASLPAPPDREPTTSPVREPRITYVEQPTPAAQDTIAWAVDRFVGAGLQLPDLQISFPVYCAGKAALYNVGRGSIEFCRIGKLKALHEFAHAWDDTSGAVDREAFLELRGLHIWFGGTEVPSHDQGSEHLAQIVAWGLMDADTRRAPNLPRNSIPELTRAFDMLTRG